MKLLHFAIAAAMVASAFGAPHEKVFDDTKLIWVKVKTFYYPAGSPWDDVEGDRIDLGCCHNFGKQFQAVNFHPNWFRWMPETEPYKNCSLVMYNEFDCGGEAWGLMDLMLKDFDKRIDFNFWAVSAGFTCHNTLHDFEWQMEMWRRRRAKYIDNVGDESGYIPEPEFEPYICPHNLPYISDEDTSINTTYYGNVGDTEGDRGDLLW